MADIIFVANVASSAFFVVLSFGLLFRYRQVSQRISASNDLGRDLWIALEQRMKKQDERILDMMGRLEVIQLRFSENPSPTRASMLSSPSPIAQSSKLEVQSQKTNPSDAVTQVEQTSQITSQITLDDTQIAVIRLLGDKPRSSVEIKELIGKSREHAARLMKTLFDEKLVSRDSSKKPFVYQLTDNGRKFLLPS